MSSMLGAGNTGDKIGAVSLGEEGSKIGVVLCEVGRGERRKGRRKCQGFRSHPTLVVNVYPVTPWKFSYKISFWRHCEISYYYFSLIEKTS